MPVPPETTSSYLHYLPAIFSDSPFLGRFLLAFEQVLTGLEGSEEKPQKGLEEIIATIAKLFSPLETTIIIADIAKLFDPQGEAVNSTEMEKQFLQWLAGWTALSLRADWTPAQQRQFLANIVPLYRFRGTKDNLVQLLKIYAGESSEPRITEPKDTPFQIGVHSTIGEDTQIGGAIPHYFQVEIKLPSPDFELLKRQEEIVSALVDLQKPAHTYYDLTILYETIQIGNPERSVIGQNMLLGNLRTFTPTEERNG
jgi:phage tail-like protein